MTILTAGREDAPPIVLLHGWGASKEIWKLVFRQPLTDRYRLVALDFPGTGAVESCRHASSTAVADWVAAEAARLGIERFAVVGHSMGGNVAVHLSQRHPDRISALVLVNPALHSDRLFRANWYLNKIVGPPVLSGARALGGLAGWVERRMPAAEFPGWTRGYMRRAGYMMFNNSLPGLRMQLKGLLSTPARLDQVRPELPVLIIHGAKDTTIPVSWSKESMELRPDNTRLIVYPKALHCPMDTHTREFCDDLAEFLDRVEQPG